MEKTKRWSIALTMLSRGDRMTASAAWSRCGTAVACKVTAAAVLALVVSPLALVVLVANQAITALPVGGPTASLYPCAPITDVLRQVHWVFDSAHSSDQSTDQSTLATVAAYVKRANLRPNTYDLTAHRAETPVDKPGEPLDNTVNGGSGNPPAPWRTRSPHASSAPTLTAQSPSVPTLPPHALLRRLLMPDNESRTDARRTPADAVISWLGWHTPEPAGVLVPSVPAATVSPWFSIAAGLVTPGWLTHDLRTAQRHHAIRAELVSEALDLRAEYRTWRKQLQAGYQERQRRSGEDERAASVIRAVDFGVVPGLLQIPPYARRVLSLHAEVQGLDRDIETAVAERMSRQTVLYDTSKQIEILVAEAGLRYPVVAPDTMRAQIDRLVGVIGLSAVRFGILPLDKPMPYFPMHGFWIIGDEVLVENMTAEIRITDEAEVRIYNDIADRLWTVAVEGDEARAVLARIAADLR
jgi:hypothetical protein